MAVLRSLSASTAISAGLALLLAACAAPPQPAPPRPAAATSPATVAAPAAQRVDLARYHWLNRLTWGASSSALAQTAGQHTALLLDQQLANGTATLPAAAQSQIAALTLSQKPFTHLMIELEQRRRDADALKNDYEKKAAQQAYQQELNRLAREAASRHILRAMYSSRQLQEQMTWFWLNHFSVFQNKANIRAMVGDYEDSAIRPHALGRFRDLLGAATLHPAMLRYLDNDQNAAGRINENYARELMEKPADFRIRGRSLPTNLQVKAMQSYGRLWRGVAREQRERCPAKHQKEGEGHQRSRALARHAGVHQPPHDRMERVGQDKRHQRRHHQPQLL
jgi:hypothetical protein